MELEIRGEIQDSSWVGNGLFEKVSGDAEPTGSPKRNR